MRLRQLEIRNFRGIKSATWRISERIAFLVGPGDSTKTTLLDAIGVVLNPNYMIQCTDTDFFRLDRSENIEIKAVVTELPDHLVKESQLGKERSGLRADGHLTHDPVDGAEECLVIRLTITPELDPTWEVIRPETDEARPISPSQRRHLGFFRLGERPDLHLRWARGSALVSLTASGEGISAAVLDAQRAARGAVFDLESGELHKASARAAQSARALGAGAFESLRPGLEPGTAGSAHALILHDGDVPLSRFGVGTQRLASLAVQSDATAAGAIIAIDEIEHGLEPHRLIQTLRHLKTRADEEEIQVIATTHSPVTLKALSASDLTVVRSNSEGVTTCTEVPLELDNIQGTVRGLPDALLARRVLVTEGATEAGLLRVLIHHWDAHGQTNGKAPAAALGSVVVNGGGGSQAVSRASHFHSLAFPTCLLVDNDDPGIDRQIKEAVNSGIDVHRWALGNAIEHQLMKDLPGTALQTVVDAAVEIRGEDSVKAALGNQLGVKLAELNVDDWGGRFSRDDIRIALAAASTVKKNEWFKREDHGEELGRIVIENWHMMADTKLVGVLTMLQGFLYPDGLGAEDQAEDLSHE